MPGMENLTMEDVDCAGCRVPDVVEIRRFQAALRAIMGKWKVEAICALVDGPRRFGELRRCLPGVTQHMLTAQLRELERDGLVRRTAHAEVPPRVEYELTEAAYAMEPFFDAMVNWSARHGHVLRNGAE